MQITQSGEVTTSGNIAIQFDFLPTLVHQRGDREAILCFKTSRSVAWKYSVNLNALNFTNFFPLIFCLFILEYSNIHLENHKVFIKTDSIPLTKFLTNEINLKIFLFKKIMIQDGASFNIHDAKIVQG